MFPFCVTWLLVVSCWFFGPAAAVAEIYTFVDPNGVIHFSNVPNDPRFVPVKPDHLRALRNGSVKYMKPAELDGHIRHAAGIYEVDPLLVKAVIKAESNFNCLAVSRRGAQGLMQLMPGTAKDMRVADPFDPRQNIRGGTRYLKKMLNLFKGDLQLALAAYNAGPEVVKSTGCVPRYPETVNYVKRVLRNYKRYQSSSPSVRTGG